MWTSVYMTQSIDNARELRLRMEISGILVMLRSIRFEDSVGENYFELLVPDAELKDALDIIVAE